MKRKLHVAQRLAVLFAVLLISLKSSAQLVAWQFYAPQSTGTEVTYASTSEAIGVEESLLTRGPGIAPASLARGFSSTITGWVSTGTTKAMALANGDYLQFTVKAKAGYTLSFKAIDDTLRRSSAGCKNYRWNYSLDGTTFTEIGTGDVLDFDPTANTNGITQPQINLSGISQLQNVPSTVTVTLRIYIWGASTSGGTFAFGRPTSGNSLTVSGNALETSGPLIGWQFGSPASVGNEVTYDATTVDTNINTPVLSRGPGLNTFTLGRGFTGTTTVTALTKSDAIANGVYYQFAVSVKPGAFLSLTSLKARLRRSSAGANLYRWNYSTDGSNFIELGTGDVSFTSVEDGVTQPDIDLSTISALQNIATGTTVTFRLYGWGFTSIGSGSFAVGRYAANEITNSLVVTGISGMVTPVNLIGFTAVKKGTNNAITWKTALEVNMSKYELQRSSNGSIFEPVYTARANNSTLSNTYNYEEKAITTVTYYRLKMINTDGSFKLSNIIKISASAQDNSIKVYPNPVTDNTTTILFPETAIDAIVNIYLASGKLVLQQKVSKNSTQATVNTGSLSSGVYFVQLNNGQSLAGKTSFVKQ